MASKSFFNPNDPQLRDHYYKVVDLYSHPPKLYVFMGSNQPLSKPDSRVSQYLKDYNEHQPSEPLQLEYVFDFLIEQDDHIIDVVNKLATYLKCPPEYIYLYGYVAETSPEAEKSERMCHPIASHMSTVMKMGTVQDYSIQFHREMFDRCPKGKNCMIYRDR